LIDRNDTALVLLGGLRQDIIERRIRSGLDRLETHLDLIERLDPASEHAPQLIWRLAQWVDVGFRCPDLVEAQLARLPKHVRCALPLRDYAAIRMAEGLAAMSHEDADEAIAHFDAVLAFQRDLVDSELLAIANFWKARSQRKKGEYEGALAHTVRARDLALGCGFERMAAVMRVLESWLCFQKGKHKEALKILGETEAVLAETDDAVVLGNIQSTYGRIYRQEGRYDQAIRHFNNAICYYRNRDDKHPHLARTLANMAYVERLVALDLRRKIDSDLARRRHPAHRSGTVPEQPQVSYREQFNTLRDAAFSHLDEAASIYRVHPNHRGEGTVHLNRGLLHLDNGALDLAEEEAISAFALGEQKEDAILMSRARILQCMVENGKLEEGIEEDPRRHAQSALEYIRDAIQLAKTTQNRRLLARVHTWHGLTLSNEFFADHAAAGEAMNMASTYLDHGFHDTAWEDLRALKTRVTGSQSVDETLLAWSQGQVGNRTFRQISDEFAEIIIPRVWEIEGRKIARVATRLSISPKKVRRALTRAGLIRTVPQGAEASGNSKEESEGMD
jgi:tetratricopeptide (TPR) repeat protein